MLTLFVRVTSMYAGEGMDNHHFTEVHDIYVKDLKCKKVNVAALVLQGTEEKPIYNVTFDNVDVDKAGIGLGFWLSGNFWLVSFKISYLCLPLFYETRTTPSCHPSGCAYRQL